jgi:hypothetical protein
MKLTRIAISGWVGFAAYSLLMFVAGPSGSARTAELMAQKTDMLNNLDELGSLSRGLADRMETLKRDPDAIALEARKLGYISERETMVTVPGGAVSKKFSNVGSVVRFKETEWSWGIYYKAIGCLAAFACWISLGTAERNSRNGAKKRRYGLRGGSLRSS